MGGHGRVVLRHPSSCLSSGQGSVAHHQLQERGGSRYKAEGLQGGDRPGARAEEWWRRRHLPSSADRLVGFLREADPLPLGHIGQLGVLCFRSSVVI